MRVWDIKMNGGVGERDAGINTKKKIYNINP
jgi:hypothetical protein